MEFPSKLVENAVEAFAQLPGIGKRTALRLVIYLLKQDTDHTEDFSDAIAKMRREVKFCNTCHNVSDTDICNICQHPKRARSTICVVEDMRDVIAIENTQQYYGVYHVLGGIISPMDGIGPEDLNITSLMERVKNSYVEEIIMAISPTIEGDTTIFYLSKHLKEFNVQVTTIARGISFGGELEYADELTLGRSIINRLPYENLLLKKA